MVLDWSAAIRVVEKNPQNRDSENIENLAVFGGTSNTFKIFRIENVQCTRDDKRFDVRLVVFAF